MDFIIVTGLSGAGKSRAVDALEDIGFYCVDNIPPKLIPVFYTLCEQAKPEMKRVAIVTDTRGGDMFSIPLKPRAQIFDQFRINIISVIVYPFTRNRFCFVGNL